MFVLVISLVVPSKRYFDILKQWYFVPGSSSFTPKWDNEHLQPLFMCNPPPGYDSIVQKYGLKLIFFFAVFVLDWNSMRENS